MRPIAVTQANYKKFNIDASEGWGFEQQQALDAMFDLNKMLDEELGGREDWGGKYGSWLDSLGIPSNSDKGWWSLAAIDPENLQAFIDAEKDEEENGWFDQCQAARRKIYEVSAVGKFTANSRKVRIVVERLNVAIER